MSTLREQDGSYRTNCMQLIHANAKKNSHRGQADVVVFHNDVITFKWPCFGHSPAVAHSTPGSGVEDLQNTRRKTIAGYAIHKPQISFLPCKT